MSKADETTDIERKVAAKELLLADHGYLTELFLKNEEIGETRVNWFIGIVTGSIGGLVVLITEGGLTPVMLRFVVLGGLFSLLGFGIVTLFRIITRNRKTDGYKADLDKVRQQFQDHFDPESVLTNYHPHVPPPKRKTLADGRVENHAQRADDGDDPKRNFGGLTHTVAAINSLIAGAFAGSIVHTILRVGSNTSVGQSLALAAGAAMITLALTFYAQCRLIEARERDSRKDLRKGRVTHAGGVVFSRASTDSILYLVVRPSDGADQWVLPKGKVEKRENHVETALREVREETGVSARIICFLDTVEYEASKPVKAKFYLMEKVFETKPSEDRETAWRPFETALAELTHDDSKYLLTIAEEFRRRKGD